MREPLMTKAEDAVIRVRVSPRASTNQVTHLEDGSFKIKLTAPAVEGKANKALQQLLAKKIGVAKTNIAIIFGEKGREKVIKIQGLSMDEVNKKLSG